MTAMKYQFGNMKVKRFLALYRERYDDIKKQNLVSCQYESSNKPLARETEKAKFPCTPAPTESWSIYQQIKY